MKLIVGLVVVLFAVKGHCESGEESGEGGKGYKKKECMRQTHALKACCPFPKNDDDFKKDPECGNLLVEMEDKKGREKFHAIVCFAECMFNSRELLSENKDINWDGVKNFANDFVGESDEFKAVTEQAVEFCESKFNEMKNHKPKHHHHHDDEKKCDWKPFGAAKCIVGYIVRDCPESVWTGTDECNALKSNVTSQEDCMKHF